MDIRNFATFNAVVEAEGFTKAAGILNYAQSTVTLHIKELEKHYGRKLFDRIGKKIYLTEFGKDLYRESKGLVKNYDDVLEIGNEDKIVEVLRIGGYESLLKYRMYDLIHEFKQIYPNVDIVIMNGTCKFLREKVKSGELDITFQVETLKDYPGLVVETLYEEKFSFIFPEGRDADMMKDPDQTVYFTEKECSYRREFENYLDRQGVVRNNIMETGSVDMIKKYVSFGLGYSMVPSISLKDEKDREGLTCVDFVSAAPMYTQLVYHKEKHVFPAMEAFIKLVKECYMV